MNVEIFENSCLIVKVSGEVDITNADQLHDAAEEAAEKSPNGFVIDLTETTYLDSAGMQAMFDAFRLVGINEGKLPIVATHPNVRDNLFTVRMDMLPGVSIVEDMVSAKKALYTSD